MPTIDQSAARTDVVVVGGGLAGVAAGLALARAGFSVRILEQAVEFGEIGAGITVPPNAARALGSLGLGPALEATAAAVDLQGTVFCDTGAVLGTKDRAELRKGPDGAPFIQMLRPDLHALLTDALRAQTKVQLNLSTCVAAIAQDESGAVAHCADGSSFAGDVLIAADGIRSTVRACAFGPDQPRFTGRVAWRGLVPAAAVRDVDIPFDSGAAVGPGRTFGWYMVRRKTLINYVALVKTDEHREEGWRIPSTPEAVLAHFSNGIPLIGALISATDPASCFKWALFDRPPQPEWVRGRVALLGDAAHPMLPYMGQGAAMGFEDAVILARALAHAEDVEQGLNIYQLTRQPRATLVHYGSAARADMWEDAEVEKGLAGDEVDEVRDLFPYDAAAVPLQHSPVPGALLERSGLRRDAGQIGYHTRGPDTVSGFTAPCAARAERTRSIAAFGHS